MSQQITLTGEFWVQNCCSCGIAFAVPLSLDKQRRDDGLAFYCPNGHSQSYTETTVMRLQKQLAAARHLTPDRAVVTKLELN